MTRPKVDPDKRQRIAQACESCKRRKQKCNGERPCGTCAKRNLTCAYGDENVSEDVQPSPKRQMVDLSRDNSNGEPGHAQNAMSPTDGKPSIWTNGHDHNGFQGNGYSTSNSVTRPPNCLSNGPDDIADNKDVDVNVAVGSGSSGQDEEAVVYTNTRMLQDPTGRLLYIGDSAVLSFLQLIRMIVENVSGPSRFTQDPNRHRIVENTVSLPPHIRQTHLLPDRQTADVLVDSYFININGLVEVCYRKTFMTTLEQCYTDPLSIDPHWLCLLHLIFAIGLVMATPRPGTPEDIIIRRLRADPVDRAELFYANAKHLCDPSTGFEDSGFWSIQALTLMSVYMLAVSRRNAAYAYYGMAVRSAFALGLHREETMCIFGGAEQSVRRNLWRTLFVLDRFLATSLGRPTAIRESDCSGTTLLTGERAPFPQAPFPTVANASFTSPNIVGLEASVRSCHVIGVILEKVYSKRKISTKLAQEIADHCKGWPKALDPSLNHRKAASANPGQGIAILHVNLLYCHSIILLTRPFYLFLMNKAYQNPAESSQRSQGSRMEKFAAACVIASTQSIALVQNAYESNYLSRRNPFVLYFLFGSSLVVLANEFCGLYQNPNANPSLTNAINIMHYFCDQDPQARRLVVILESFREVVVQQQSFRAQQQHDAAQHPGGLIQPLTLSLAEDNNDAMANLFQGVAPFSTVHGATAPVPGLNRISNDSNPPNPLTFSPVNHTQSHPINTFSPPANRSISPQNSFDAFFDLARVSSNQNSGASNDGNESFGDAEIDFDALWQLSNTNGPPLTPGVISGLTPGGILGGVQLGLNEVQGISDSRVPLYGISNGDLGGSG